MKRETKDNLILIGAGIMLCLLIIRFFIGLYAFATYGGLPITEVPAWAWWIMQNGGTS